MDQYPALHVGTSEQFSDAPPGSYAYRLQVEEAKDSEALLGLYNDLNYVVRITRLLVSMDDKTESHEDEEANGVREVPLEGPGQSEQELTARALWEAALVAYARCFHRGKRRWLNESIFEGQDEDMLVWHRYFKNTRDKHVAHSVNPFESYVTFAYVADLDTVPRLTGVYNMQLIRAGEHVTTVEWLGSLATYVLEALEPQRKEALDRLWKAAKSLSPAELRRLPILEVTPEQGFDVPGKDRR